MKRLGRNSVLLVRLLFVFVVILILYFITIRVDDLNRSSIDWKTVNVDRLRPQEIIDYFYWTNRSSCKLVHDFGGFMMRSPSGLDGQKAVCLDPGVRPPAGNCVVYSFGINNEWSFDDTMEKYGCKVFSFDPNMNVGDHSHSHKIKFFNLGLGDRDHVTADGKAWTIKKYKTLSSIHEMLLPHHGGKTIIDYLKMDIEFAEWDVIPQIISSGMLAKVRQLAVEFHLPENGDIQLYRSLVRIIKSIEDAGMVRFDSKFNPWFTGQIKALSDSFNVSLGYEIAFYQFLKN